jgi:DNA polymerase III epsilon subunit-like protein
MIHAEDFEPKTELWIGSAGPESSTFQAHDGSIWWAVDASSKKVLALDPNSTGVVRVRRPGESALIAPWQYATWAGLDLETTGLGPSDKVVEIAIVAMRFGIVVDVWSSLVNPGIPIPAEATATHGITDAMVQGAPKIGDLAAEIIKRLDSAAVIVGYNIYGYDEEVLERELPGIWAEAKPRIDPLPVVRSNAVGKWWKSEFVPNGNGEPIKEGEPRRKKPGRHSLDRASRELGVTFPEPGVAMTLHRATWDALLGVRVCWSLRGYMGHEATTTEEVLRRDAKRQVAEIEAFKAKKAAEDAQRVEQQLSIEERVSALESKLAELERTPLHPSLAEPAAPAGPRFVDVHADDWPADAVLFVADGGDSIEMAEVQFIDEQCLGRQWSGLGHLAGTCRRALRLEVDGRPICVRLPSGENREVAR